MGSEMCIRDRSTAIPQSARRYHSDFHYLCQNIHTARMDRVRYLDRDAIFGRLWVGSRNRWRSLLGPYRWLYCRNGHDISALACKRIPRILACNRWCTASPRGDIHTHTIWDSQDTPQAPPLISCAGFLRTPQTALRLQR